MQMGAGRLSGSLKITVISATVLRSEEPLDAYCTVRCGNHQSTTHTAKEQGSLPSWNKTFKFTLDDVNDTEEVLFEIFGVQPELDELLGLARIPISKAVSAEIEIVTLNKPGGGEAGQLKVDVKWIPEVTRKDTSQVEKAFFGLNLGKERPEEYVHPATAYPPEYPPSNKPLTAYPPEYPPLADVSYPPKTYDYPPTVKPFDKPYEYPKAAEYPPYSPESAYPPKDAYFAPQGGKISVHPPLYGTPPEPYGSPPPVLPTVEVTSRGLGDKHDKGKLGSSGYGYPPPGDPYGYPPAQHGQGYPPTGYPPAQGGYPPAPAGYPPAGYPPQPGAYPAQPGGYPPAGSSHTDSRLGGHGITGAIAGAAASMLGGHGAGGYGAHGYGYGAPGAHGGGYGAHGAHGGGAYGAHGGYGTHGGYGPPAHGYGHGYGHGKHGKHGKHMKHGGYGYGKHKGGKHGKHGKFGKWK